MFYRQKKHITNKPCFKWPLFRVLQPCVLLEFCVFCCKKWLAATIHLVSFSNVTTSIKHVLFAANCPSKLLKSTVYMVYTRIEVCRFQFSTTSWALQPKRDANRVEWHCLRVILTSLFQALGYRGLFLCFFNINGSLLLSFNMKWLFISFRMKRLLFGCNCHFAWWSIWNNMFETSMWCHCGLFQP